MSNFEADYSYYFWQGQLLRLRPLGSDDVENSFLTSLDSPSRQTLQLGIELPTSAEILRTSLVNYFACKEHNGVIIFVMENLDNEAVGGISLHSMDQKNGRFSFGIVTFRPYWGKGYATEAIRILLKYGFWERRYQKCNSACVDSNEASYRLHKKLGFIEEGRRRRQHFFNGQYYDDVLFGMIREEFDVLEKARTT